MLSRAVALRLCHLLPCCCVLSESDETVEQQVLGVAADRVSGWVALETSREGRHWLPWRPNYDVGESSIEDCEDPDRVVIFDDLSGALFEVEPIQDRFHLISRFLDFVGRCLPTSHSSERTDLFTLEEQITDSGLWWKVEEAFPDADSLSAFSEVRLAQSELEKMSAFVENVFTQIAALFDGDLRTALTLRFVHFKVTAGLLLRNGAADRRQRKHAEKELRNFFKSLLKQEHNRGNLAIWERYARFEWEIGNHDDARKVFETALAMADSTAAGNDEFPVIHLYGTYSLLEAGVGILRSPGICPGSKSTRSVECSPEVRSRHAVRILAMAVNGYRAHGIGAADVSPAEILRARHFYQHRLDDMHTTFAAVVPSDTERMKCHGRHTFGWTTCFALFQLLTVGLSSASSVVQNFQANFRRLFSDISAATVAVDPETQDPAVNDRSKSENPNGSVCRDLLRAAARLQVQLAQFCLNSHTAPLSAVRAALSDALAEFPDDVWFLKSFVNVELSSHVSGRLRDYFHHAVCQANTPRPVLYAVLAERKRLLRLSTHSQAPCM